MKALVYHGPGVKAWEDVPDPMIEDSADAIVRVDAVTICGTDLHILNGDVPEVASGRVARRMLRRTIIGIDHMASAASAGAKVSGLIIGSGKGQ